MNLLITNSVPLNGGDEALLRATVESLYLRYPAAKITVLCSKNLELCKTQAPDLNLDFDLEIAPGNQINRPQRVKRKLARLLRQSLGQSIASKLIDVVLEPKGRQQIIELYRTADIVISSPGGFLHDFYSITDRLYGLELAIDLGKPVIIFAQSVGPFWKPESIKRAANVLNRVSAICVRDEISAKYLLDIGVCPEQITVTADAAFLWHNIAPDLFSPSLGPVKKVGLCFRIWPLNDTKNATKTVEKAVELCKSLLKDPDVSLVFISTCQGIEGYVDDSEISLEIVALLPDEFQNRCEIDRDRYAPRALIKRLSSFDAFISMRLHGCILAMLGGTPAMGLGYEDKTEQVFKQLDLEKYQVKFDADLAEWLDCEERFINNADSILSVLPQSIRNNCQTACKNLDAVSELLCNQRSNSIQTIVTETTVNISS